jgi:CHAT domain-containing protein
VKPKQILECLKLQELNDFTQGTRAAAPIPEVSFNPAETQIKTQHTSLVAFGSKLYECDQQQPRCPQYTDLNTQYQSLFKEFIAFVEQIQQQQRDGRLNQINQSTQDFQTSADRIVTAHPNSLLIYPLVLPDKTRLLWASKGGVLSKTATCPLGEKALYGKVSEFQKLLRDRGDETQLKIIGKELYDCLIKPMESELTANQIKHLIFVPDLATNYIPMGALFDGKQYLIQRFAVSNILSAGLTDTEDKLKSPQQTSVLALGLSQATGTFSALPNVEAELGAIVQKPGNTGIYPGNTYLNQAFTKTALEDNIRGHNILHIATHGEFKPTNPRSSYFLLGTGTPYPIPDIQALRDLKDVHLVVLSACQTGLGGADGLGLEVSGISSFLLGDRDKAKAVLASLWNVNDASTTLLMQLFYKNLAQGLSKPEAMQQAQLRLLSGQQTAKDAPARAELEVRQLPGARRDRPADFSHPYYWAPFILIGNGL